MPQRQHEPSTPLALYRQRTAALNLHPDAAQDRAMQALQNLYEQEQKNTHTSLLHRFLPVKPKKGTQGVYLHGGVGRGKSMLMDLFCDSLPPERKKRRVHFHAFMMEIHDWMHQRRGEKMDNLLPSCAAHVAKQTRILCFDEFHVTDVADAMILARLFTSLFDKGVKIVITSNWPPERLYEGGLQRELFLPFITLLKERMQIIHVNGETDYRTEKTDTLEVYFHPLGQTASQKADDMFAGLTGCAPARPESLQVKGRTIDVPAASCGAARFSFAELCERPHGAEDYLAITEKYETIFIEGVPKMSYDRRNEAKRFMTLIDVLYDANRKIVITADAPPDKLYYGHDHAFEFQRTVSRLQEIQSADYFCRNDGQL